MIRKTSIAKIAYCQTVVNFGLRGFRRLVLPDIILGRYPLIPYFVGCPLDDPDPPSHPNVKHAIQLSTVARGRLRLILATVPLFSNSGTDRNGPSTYYVICGAPALPQP